MKNNSHEFNHSLQEFYCDIETWRATGLQACCAADLQADGIAAAESRAGFEIPDTADSQTRDTRAAQSLLRVIR